MSPISMKKRLLAGAGAAALMAGVMASAAHAEDYTTGTVAGLVRDTAGTAVTGATINLKSAKGVNRTITSDDDGKFRMPQLPIGKYTVTIMKDGYEQLTSELAVALGSAGNYTFTMSSMDSTIEEVFITGTRQGAWGFNSTTTGLTVNVDELFEKTPINRDATSVALLAPGTGEGDSAFAGGEYGATGTTATFGGSSVGENAYYVNGLNVTNFRTSIGGSTIPFEFYEQLEVKTGGYQAEFGRSTGGVINAVTKSGSNEFHFGANVFWEPNAFYEDSPDTFAANNHLDETSSVEYNFWASGAIVKDKLFFYGLYNPRNIRSFDCSTTRCTEQTRNSPFYGAKIDFVPFDGHRLEYTFFSDKQDSDTVVYSYDSTLDSAVGLIGDATYHNGGTNHIYKYTGSLTDWFTISALYGENKYARGRDAIVDTPSIAEYRNGAPGNPVGENVAGSFTFGEDTRKATRVDADFYFEAAGDHHVRVGWDREKLQATENTRYAGYAALRYYTSGSSSTGERVRFRQYWNEGNFKTIQSAFYIQDSWQPLENLMLNVGFRNETFDNRNAAGDTFVKMKNQKAWRLGFTWDPTNDGRNKVYGNWGRFYLPVATNTNIRMAGRELYVQQYYELPAGWDQNTPYIIADRISAEDLEAILAGDLNGGQLVTTATNGDALTAIGGIGVYADGKLKGTAATTDANLKPMYQDEWIIGADHDFDNGWRVGVRYVHRNLGRMIEDVAIDAAVLDWAEANDLDASVYSGFHQYVLTNPGSAMTIMTDGVVDADGNNADQVVTFTPEELGYPVGKRTYDAIDITFSREWDGKWSLDGSYTWSKSKGNYEGSVKSENGQDDAGLTQDFDQPGFVDGANGYLPNDRRHRFKMWGSYAVNDWLTVGGLLKVEAPRKFGCIGEHPTDLFAWYYGAASWYCGGELTPRGSKLKSDWTKELNLSLSIRPQISDEIPGDLTFRVDVFNVFNSKAVQDLWEFGELGFTSDYVFGGTTGADADPDYGKPTRYQTPRHVRFSATYRF